MIMDLRHAVGTPRWARAAVVALGLVIGAAALWSARSPRAPRLSWLELEVASEASCFYGSAWNDGPVFVVRGDVASPLVFTRRFAWIDGCTWEATETLTPIGAGTYRYRYVEQPASCSDSPYPACTREGIVTARPAADASAPAPIAPTAHAGLTVARPVE
jgi:hypothetical protein